MEIAKVLIDPKLMTKLDLSIHPEKGKKRKSTFSIQISVPKNCAVLMGFLCQLEYSKHSKNKIEFACNKALIFGFIFFNSPFLC